MSKVEVDPLRRPADQVYQVLGGSEEAATVIVLPRLTSETLAL